MAPSPAGREGQLGRSWSLGWGGKGLEQGPSGQKFSAQDQASPGAPAFPSLGPSPCQVPFLLFCNFISVSVYPDRVFMYQFLSTSEDPHNEAWLTLQWGHGLSIRSWFSHRTVCPFTGHCGMSAGSVSRHAGHPLSEGQVLFPSSPL